MTHEPIARIDLAPRTIVAHHWWQRLRGLLGTRVFPAHTVWVFPHTNLIHMWGMRYAIDVLFVDRNGVIIKHVAQLAPGQMAGAWRAYWTIECAPGTIARLNSSVTYRIIQWDPQCQLIPVADTTTAQK